MINENINGMALSEQEIVRRQALEEIRALGIDPYPHEAFPVNTSASVIKKDFTEEHAESFQEVKLAGRLMSRRVMGKASFAELQDSSGRIQIYVSRDDICPEDNKDLYNKVFKKLCSSSLMISNAHRSCLRMENPGARYPVQG